MGRRKIEIKCITNERNRSVTFLKRKNGLFKKAYELGVLCSVDVAVIIFGGPVGQKHKLYEYCSGDVDKIVKKRLNFNGDRDAKGPEDFGENKSKAEDGEDGEDDEVDDDSDAPAPAKPTKTKAKAAAPSKRAAPARSPNKRQQTKFDDDDDDSLETIPMDVEPPPPSRTPVIAAVAAAYARSLGNKAAAADGERYPSDHLSHEPVPKRQRRGSTSTASSRDPYHHHSSPYHGLPPFGQSNDVGYPGGAYPGSSGTMPPPPPGSNSGHHHHAHGYGSSGYGATHPPDASLPALSLLRHPSVPNLSHYGSPYLGPSSSHSHNHSGAPPRLGSGGAPTPMNVNINISRELMDAFALHQAQQGAGGPGGIHSSSVAASAHTSGSHRSGPNGLAVHHPPPMSTGSTGFEWPSTTPQPPATPNLGSANGSSSGPGGDHDTSWLDIFSSSSGSTGAAATERREPNTGSELMELFGNIASLGDLARTGTVGSSDSGGDRKRRFDSM